MKKNKHKKIIYIPHLNFTIKIDNVKNYKGEKPSETSTAWVVSDGKKGCTLYTPYKSLDADLLHEVIHILQFICLERNINFCLEQEHIAYLGQYIMGQLKNYQWK